MELYDIIINNDLYPDDIQTYVQPFNDGTQFFWKKTPCYTQFINDENGRYELFLKSLREKIQLQKDSIYFQHQQYTQDIEIIRKSNFFNRIANTYLFSRTYDRTIFSTDSDKTFYLCFKKPTQTILNDFANIQGKFLFVYEINDKDKNLLCLNEIKPLNTLSTNGYEFVFNYEPKKTYDLFNL